MNQKNVWLLVGLCLPVMIACVDIMAVSVAMNDIMHDLATTLARTQWLLSGCTIGTASFLITIGRLADKYGRKRLLLLGIIIFALSSLIAAIATTINLLIIGRFIQGIASSMMMTTVIAIITHHYPPEKRGPVLAIWGSTLGVGMTLGPLVGGLCIHLANWRAIFLINIPICFLTYLLSIKFIPESKDNNAQLTIHWLETITLTITLLLLMTIFSEGDQWGWLSATMQATIALCLGTSFFLAYIERHQKYPLIDFSLFKNPNFTIAGICGFISYFCMYAWLFIFSIYLQTAYNMTPLMTGLLLSFFSLSFAVTLKIIGRSINIIGSKVLIQIGFILAATAFYWMTSITVATPIWKLALIFFLLGTGITIINVPSMAAATLHIPPHKTGVASGIIFTIRWLGGSIGVAVITIIYKYANQVSLMNTNINTSPVKHLHLESLFYPCLALTIAATIGLVFSFKLSNHNMARYVTEKP